MSLTGIIIIAILWIAVIIWGVFLFKGRKKTKEVIEDNIINDIPIIPKINLTKDDLAEAVSYMSRRQRKELFSHNLPTIQDLKSQRLKLGLSQKIASDLANIPPSNISQIETGKRSPMYNTVQRMVSLYYKDNKNFTPSLKTLCREFRKVRRELELSLLEVSEYARVNYKTIQRIENYKNNNSADFHYNTIKALFDYYKTRIQ